MYPSSPQPVDRGEPLAPPAPFADVYVSSEFAELRRRCRVFTFTVGGLVLGWLLLLFWAVGYVPELMTFAIGGHITVGLVFAWSQVVTTLLVAALFVRHSRMNRSVVAELRRRLDERGER